MTTEENSQHQNRSFPRSLENANPKGAFSTFPPPPLRLLHSLNNFPKGDLFGACLPLSLQAHLWIRKDSAAPKARPALGSSLVASVTAISP
jgi:hypothetical protein